MKKSDYKKAVEEYKTGLELSIEMSRTIINNGHTMIDIYKRSISSEIRRIEADTKELKRVTKQLKTLK